MNGYRVGAGTLPRLIGAALFLTWSMAGCDLPRDPQGTLQHVRGGTLRVGIMQEFPWAYAGGDDGGPKGVEVELLSELAAQLKADVSWVHGADARLMSALERYELDVVVGGIVADTAWKNRVGLTQPYFVGRAAWTAEDRLPTDRRPKKHVIAVPPGENAWLLYVDRFLQQQKPDIPRLLQRQQGRR